MKKIKETLLAQRGSVTVEFAVTLILLLVIILFMVDLFTLISQKGKLDRVSYSLLNIVKEQHVIDYTNQSYNSKSGLDKLTKSLSEIENLMLYGNASGGLQLQAGYFVEVAHYTHGTDPKPALKGVVTNKDGSIDYKTTGYFSFGVNAVSGKFTQNCTPHTLLTSQSGMFNVVWDKGGRRPNTKTMGGNLTALKVDNSYTPVYRVTVCMPYRSAFSTIYELTGVDQSSCGKQGVLCASSVGIGR